MKTLNDKKGIFSLVCLFLFTLICLISFLNDIPKTINYLKKYELEPSEKKQVVEIKKKYTVNLINRTTSSIIVTKGDKYDSSLLFFWLAFCFCILVLIILIMILRSHWKNRNLIFDENKVISYGDNDTYFIKNYKNNPEDFEASFTYTSLSMYRIFFYILFVLFFVSMHVKYMSFSSEFNKSHTKLFNALSDNDTYTVKYLIAGGANVNDQFERGETPLLIAMKKNNDELIDYFLNNNALVNVYNADRKSPLFIAIDRNNLVHAKKLISLGAEVNFKGPNYKTLLRVAINNGDVEMVKLLVSSGAEEEGKTSNELIEEARHRVFKSYQERVEEALRMINSSLQR